MRQLIGVSREFAFPDTSLRIRLFWNLVGFRWWAIRDWVAYRRLLQVPDYELTRHVNFLFDQQPDLNTWRVDKYRRWIGPDQSMSAVTWHEFTLADSFFLRYKETGEEIFLKMLCATLFRRKGRGRKHNPNSGQFTGDQRKPFNPNIPDKELKSIERWPEWIRGGVLLNYEGIRRHLEEQFPHVFSQENKNNIINGPKGWEPVTLSLSGEKFGTYDQTLRTPFKTVLRHMEMNAIEIERIKSKDHG